MSPERKNRKEEKERMKRVKWKKRKKRRRKKKRKTRNVKSTGQKFTLEAGWLASGLIFGLWVYDLSNTSHGWTGKTLNVDLRSTFKRYIDIGLKRVWALNWVSGRRMGHPPLRICIEATIAAIG